MIPFSYPSPRVSQLDAGILDSELLTLLKEQLSSIFQLHNNSRFSYIQHPELYSLLLNLLIFKLTVWKSGSSYGSSLQNLKFVDTKTGKIIGFSKKTLLGLVIVGGYLYRKLEAYLYSIEETESSSSTNRIGRFFVNNRINILSKIDNLVKIANLINFTVFLVNGKYSSVVNRLLRITETPVSSDLLKFNGSNVNYEFQNRQLVWNVMTEFLVFILPLLQLKKMGRMARKLLGKSGNAFEVQSGNQPVLTPYTNLPASECAICHDTNNQAAASGGRVFPSAGPVTNPYITNCGHIYCYVCISTRFNMIKMNNEDLPCLRCGQRLEWFEEFGSDDRQVDEDAITIQPEVEEDEEEEEENDAEPVDDFDDEASISSEKELQSYEPETNGTKIQRHLSERSVIFDDRSADEFSDDEFSEEEDYDADEMM